MFSTKHSKRTEFLWRGTLALATAAILTLALDALADHKPGHKPPGGGGAGGAPCPCDPDLTIDDSLCVCVDVFVDKDGDGFPDAGELLIGSAPNISTALTDPDLVPDSLTQGLVLIVQPGIYDEEILIDHIHGGHSLTIRADDDTDKPLVLGSIRIDTSNVTLRNLEITNGVVLKAGDRDCENCRVEGLVITGGLSRGIAIEAHGGSADFTVLSSNDISGNIRFGIVILAGHHVTVTDNTILDLTPDVKGVPVGIRVWGRQRSYSPADIVIADNFVTVNDGDGIQFRGLKRKGKGGPARFMAEGVCLDGNIISASGVGAACINVEHVEPEETIIFANDLNDATDFSCLPEDATQRILVSDNNFLCKFNNALIGRWGTAEAKDIPIWFGLSGQDFNSSCP